MPVMSIAVNNQIVACYCGACHICKAELAKVAAEEASKAALETVEIDGWHCIVVHYENLDEFYQGIHDDEFPFGCRCGESHSTPESAFFCSKCRKYLSDEDNSGDIYYTPPREA